MQHPDEGMIHAWLDDELPEDQANEISTHVSECPECSARVAEARGLMAASTRILTALDDLPRGVTPKESPGVSESAAPAFLPLSRDRRWYDRTDVRAAAAVLFVAGASLILVRTRPSQPAREMMTISAERAQAALKVIGDSNTSSPSAAEDQAAAATAQRAVGGNDADRLSMDVPASLMAGGVAKVLPPSANSGVIARKADVTGRTRADTPAPGVVEGRVIDRNSGKDVTSAEITVVGAQLRAFSDSSGKFTIVDVPAGNQQLAIRRIGYAQQHIALTVGQDANVTANIALEPTTSELSQVVVTGVGATSNLATVPLRVVRVDSIADTRRTIYELSRGIRVTLTDSALDARTDKDIDVAQATRRSMAAGPRPANSPQEKSADSIKAEAATQTSAAGARKKVLGAAISMAAPPKVNVLTWTDRGHHYVLRGPLTMGELEALKIRIMQTRR